MADYGDIGKKETDNEPSAFAFFAGTAISDTALIAMLCTEPKKWEETTNLTAIRSSSKLVSKIESSGFTLTGDQKEALYFTEALMTAQRPDSPKCLIVSGRAGTGKTTVLTEIAKWCDSNKQAVMLLAQTNSAKVNAEKRSAGFFNTNNSRTLHSLLYGRVHNGKFSYGKPKPLPAGIKLIIVDEASLVSSQVLRDLLTVVKNRGDVKLIIFGDKLQLPAVEDAYEQHSTKFDIYPLQHSHVELKQVLRQKEGPVLKLATHIAERIEEQERKRLLGESVDDLKINNLIPWQEIPMLDIQNISDGVFRYRKEGFKAKDIFKTLWNKEPGSSVLIVARNEDRVAQNIYIRNELLAGKKEMLIPDEPLIVLANANTDYTNGTLLKAPSDIKPSSTHEIEVAGEKIYIYEAKSSSSSSLQPDLFGESDDRIKFALFPSTSKPSISDFERLVRICPALEGAIPVTYAYAITAHKAQGMEWKNVIIAPNRVENTVRNYPDGVSRWLYSALTRAKELAIIWQPD